MGQRLQGKTTVVTGGARGIGAATARLFAREGANVVIADVLPEGVRLAEDIGERALFVEHDVASEHAWSQLTASVTRAFGIPTVLVNNAGVVCIGEILDLPFPEFERTLRINLGGCCLGMKALAPGMISAGGGSIVNISSTEGLQGTNALGGYAASKWGVRGLTKVAAMEWSHKGIRVNSVHPGPINTPMANPGNLSFAQMGQVHKALPIGRVGTPEEIAAVSLFLASDDASFVTGAEIAADGGMTIGNYLTFLPGCPPALAPAD